MLLGSVMLAAGSGHPPRLWAEDGWTDDPDAYDQAVQAATMVLEAARPDGAHFSNSSWGVYTATDLIKAVRGDAGDQEILCARRTQNSFPAWPDNRSSNENQGRSTPPCHPTAPQPSIKCHESAHYPPEGKEMSRGNITRRGKNSWRLKFDVFRHADGRARPAM
jgi:hypothetical protein